MNGHHAALEEKHWEISLANGRSLTLGKRTLIMGILNVTPDSFSDGGRFFNIDDAVKHAVNMAADGADIIDIGGASSRPDSVMVDEEEELRRVIPVVKRLAQKNLILSVDTFRARVAEEALSCGAHLINDIGGLELDPELLKVLAKWQAPVVLMHNRLQLRTDESYDDLVADIISTLREAINRANNHGLGIEKLIVDPGLGFGKTLEQNRLLIKRLPDFKSLGRPLLIGASRKAFIGKTLDLPPEKRLEGSLAVLVMAIMNGAHIIRVHDVKESKRAAQMTDMVRAENG